MSMPSAHFSNTNKESNPTIPMNKLSCLIASWMLLSLTSANNVQAFEELWSKDVSSEIADSQYPDIYTGGDGSCVLQVDDYRQREGILLV